MSDFKHNLKPVEDPNGKMSSEMNANVVDHSTYVLPDQLKSLNVSAPKFKMGNLPDNVGANHWDHRNSNRDKADYDSIPITKPLVTEQMPDLENMLLTSTYNVAGFEKKPMPYTEINHFNTTNIGNVNWTAGENAQAFSTVPNTKEHPWQGN